MRAISLAKVAGGRLAHHVRHDIDDDAMSGPHRTASADAYRDLLADPELSTERRRAIESLRDRPARRAKPGAIVEMLAPPAGVTVQEMRTASSQEYWRLQRARAELEIMEQLARPPGSSVGGGGEEVAKSSSHPYLPSSMATSGRSVTVASNQRQISHTGDEETVSDVQAHIDALRLELGLHAHS